MLWRYLDLTKFLYLLETRALFFARLSALKDPFEGHPPRRVVEAFKNIPAGLLPDEHQKRVAVAKQTLHTFKNSRRLICASCWHANDTESAAMWNLYLKSGEGIAIRTTFERMKAAFVGGEPSVSAGVVQYVDYESYDPGHMNILVWAMLKRLSFAHEREFRAVILTGSSDNNGIALPIDLETLVADVFVSPVTAEWIVELMQKMMNRYGLARIIQKSKMDEGPLYYVLDDR